jgi:hypothetical protein
LCGGCDRYGTILDAQVRGNVQDYGRAIRVEYDKPESAAKAKQAMHGKKALKKKMIVLLEKDSRGLSGKVQMEEIEVRAPVHKALFTMPILVFGFLKDYLSACASGGLGK